MTVSEAEDFGWTVAAAVLPFVFLVCLVLMGLALLHWMSR